LSDVHDVFRVPEEQLPMEDLDAKEDLSYQEYHQDFGNIRQSYVK
jgi:hypothetical protein